MPKYPIARTFAALNAFGGGGASIPVPAVDSFLPTSAEVGEQVVVTGSGFTDAAGVTINGVAVTTFTVDTDEQITLTVPTNATTGVIAVTTAGGTGVSAGNLTVDNLVLTATTVSPAQTVTLQRITPTGAAIKVYWGDGSDSTIASGNTGATTHAYATAAAYTVRVEQPRLITYLDLRDAKVGCTAGEVGSLENLVTILFNNLTSMTVGAGEIGGLTNLVNVTLYNSSSLTVGADELASLVNAVNIFLLNVDNVALQTDFAPSLVNLQYENNLSQANVDAVLAGLYAGFPTRTDTGGAIDLLGDGNAAPTGTSPGSAECPPTTGWNTAYELVNDSCGVSANHFASVTCQT